MKQIIEYLMVVDKGFYRHYPEMLNALVYNQALTPWQMSVLLWRIALFKVPVSPSVAFRVSIATEREKDEIRFMKGWKLKQLCRVLSPWQVRQCEEIRRKL